jgi:hypothetical protein
MSHHATKSRSHGAATVEFTIVATTALIPFVLAILQLGLLYVAKHTVQHATYLAARAGAVDHGSREAMRRYFAKGLVPLYARSAKDLSRDTAAAGITRAYAVALLDARRPDRTRISVVNPTAASFEDFERRQNGVLQIPNRFEPTAVGPRSGQALADANVLRIRIDYCAELVVPFIDRLLTATLRAMDPEPFRQQCYAGRRMPVVGYATVQMHSALRRSAIAPV